jgi:hypothetical protein
MVNFFTRKKTRWKEENGRLSGLLAFGPNLGAIPFRACLDTAKQPKLLEK